MVKFLYTNGDSWTCGNGLDQDPTLDPRENNISRIWEDRSWPKRLADQFGCDHVNDGYGGGSNQRILRVTSDFVRKWPASRRNDLLVVLGWTTSERDEAYVEYDKWQGWTQLNAWQKFSDQWSPTTSPLPDHVIKDINRMQELKVKYTVTAKECWERYLRDVWLMANTLENLGIKFIFFNSLDSVMFPGTQLEKLPQYAEEVAYISDQRFTGMGQRYSMWKFCRENDIPLSPCIHPMIEGHRRWAEHLYSQYHTIYEQDSNQKGS